METLEVISVLLWLFVERTGTFREFIVASETSAFVSDITSKDLNSALVLVRMETNRSPDVWKIKASSLPT